MKKPTTSEEILSQEKIQESSNSDEIEYYEDEYNEEFVKKILEGEKKGGLEPMVDIKAFYDRYR